MPCAHDWPFREMRWRVRRQIHISGEMLESRQTRWNVLEYERGGRSGGDVTQHWVLVTEETTVQAESAGLTLPGHTHINTIFNRDVRKFICTNKRRLLLLAGPEGRLCFRCVHLVEQQIRAGGVVPPLFSRGAEQPSLSQSAHRMGKVYFQTEDWLKKKANIYNSMKVLCCHTRKEKPQLSRVTWSFHVITETITLFHESITLLHSIPWNFHGVTLNSTIFCESFTKKTRQFHVFNMIISRDNLPCFESTNEMNVKILMKKGENYHVKMRKFH